MEWKPCTGCDAPGVLGWPPHDHYVPAPDRERPCVGGCGRDTNGRFTGGTHGPGYYCGWCDAVPSSR